MTNSLRTIALMALLTALFVWLGGEIAGQQGAAIALVAAAGMNVFAYWFSDRIVLQRYRARELGPEDDSRLYRIVAELAAGHPVVAVGDFNDGEHAVSSACATRAIPYRPSLASRLPSRTTSMSPAGRQPQGVPLTSIKPSRPRPSFNISWKPARFLSARPTSTNSPPALSARVRLMAPLAILSTRAPFPAGRVRDRPLPSRRALSASRSVQIRRAPGACLRR